MSNGANSIGVPVGTMAALMLSVFTVSMGYGIVLPLLPNVIERLLGEAANGSKVASAAGLLTALYTFALFLFAPWWGYLSDRYGRRAILLIGLTGFGATMLTFAFIENLRAIYAERFLSGLFAAAITPVALAAIGDLAATEVARARRLTFVSLTGISGFLLGPMLGVFISRGAADTLHFASAVGALAFPLGVTAILALICAVAVAVSVSGSTPRAIPSKDSKPQFGVVPFLVPQLLILAFIVSAAVGVFEVGLALRGKQELELTQYQIAVMFTECSLVMLIVQAVVFSTWVNPEWTRWLIAPAFVVLSAGLFLIPQASNFTLMLVVVGAVAASAGILSPILTYWISSRAGKAQGVELGKQTAASSLGVTLGSAAGGLLFNAPWFPNASFVLITGLTVCGALLSLRLPKLLVTRKVVGSVFDDDNRFSSTPTRSAATGRPSA